MYPNDKISIEELIGTGLQCTFEPGSDGDNGEVVDGEEGGYGGGGG